MTWRSTTKISELREYAKVHGWTEDEYDWTFKKTEARIFHADIGIDRFDDNWVVTGEIKKQFPFLECYAHARNFEFSFQPIRLTRSEGFGTMLDAMKFFDAMVNLFNWAEVWVGVSPAWIPLGSTLEKSQDSGGGETE